MEKVIEASMEIRYDAYPKILDIRGTLTDYLKEKQLLTHWGISQDLIRLNNENKTESAILGHKNVAYFVVNPPTDNYFSDKVQKFLKAILEFDNYLVSRTILRIGVRYKFLNKVEYEFDEYVKIFKSTVLSNALVASYENKAGILDIGVILNCKDNSGNFNFTCGPMKKEQSITFFKTTNKDEIPEVGLFYDVDYFSEPKKVVSQNELINKIKEYSSLCKKRNEILVDLFKEYNMVTSCAIRDEYFSYTIDSTKLPIGKMKKDFLFNDYYSGATPETSSLTENQVEKYEEIGMTSLDDFLTQGTTSANEILEKNEDIVNNIANNYDIEYSGIIDSSNVLNEKVWERIKMTPLPIKIYMTVFGLLSIMMIVLIGLQLLTNILLWHPFYTILGLISSIGLFATSYTALKDWNKIGERNCQMIKK